MGFKDILDKRRAKTKEDTAFKGIIQRKAQATERQAFARESLKVAEQRGIERARRGSFAGRILPSKKKAVKFLRTAKRIKPSRLF